MRFAFNGCNCGAVIRFTREQLISLRKDSRLLPSMATMPDIVSHETLSPVCFSRLEPEDVRNILPTLE